jgi:hypothetical protein
MTNPSERWHSLLISSPRSIERWRTLVQTRTSSTTLKRNYDAVVGQLLAAHVPGEDRWLFAYGSLRTGSNLPEPRVPSTLRYCTSLPGDGNDPRVINTSVLAQPHQTTYFHLRQNAYDRFRGHLRPGDHV